MLLRILNHLADKHSILCIGGERRPLEMNNKIEYIRSFRVSSLGLLISFISFHISHLLVYLWAVAVKKRKFDIVQTKDGESFVGNVITFHFCDAAYLRIAHQHGLFVTQGLKVIAATTQLIILYFLRTLVEMIVCKSNRTKKIIAVSRGLAEDIETYYKPKVKPVVIPNSLP